MASALYSFFSSVVPSGPVLAPGAATQPFVAGAIRSGVTTAVESAISNLATAENRQALGNAGGSIATRTLTRTLRSGQLRRDLRGFLRHTITNAANEATTAFAAPARRTQLAHSIQSIATRAIRGTLRAQTIRNNVALAITRAITTAEARAAAALTSPAIQESLTATTAHVATATLADAALQAQLAATIETATASARTRLTAELGNPDLAAQLRATTEGVVDAAAARFGEALTSAPVEGRIEAATNRAIDIATDRAIQNITSEPFIAAATAAMTQAGARAFRELSQSAHPSLVEASDALESLYSALLTRDRKALIEALDASIKVLDSLQGEHDDTLGEIFLQRGDDNLYSAITPEVRTALRAEIITLQTSLSDYLQILNGSDTTARTQEDLSQTRTAIITSLVDSRGTYVQIKQNNTFPAEPQGLLVKLLKYRNLQEGALTCAIFKTHKTAINLFNLPWFKRKPRQDQIDLPHFQRLDNSKIRWNNLSWFRMIALTIQGVGARMSALTHRVLRAVHLQ